MQALPWLAVVAVLTILLTVPLFAGDDVVQLHTQVQALVEQVSRLERSVDENVGLMTDLMNRNSETTRSMERDVEQLQNHLEQQNTMVGAQFGKIGLRVGAMQTELGDLKARLEAVTRSPVAPIVPQTPSPTASPQALLPPANAKPQPVEPRPSPEPLPAPLSEPASAMELYSSAMGHYASKDFETAAEEFAKFLKADHQSENATNAQFLLAEIEYQEKDFEGALDDYTAVGPRLSDQAKAARAQYKKALCLIEVDREDEAILELQALRTRYPHSVEAAQAAKKLRALGARGAIRP